VTGGKFHAGKLGHDGVRRLPFASTELDAILADARAENSRNGITGDSSPTTATSCSA
jgi:hypothetical protein